MISVFKDGKRITQVATLPEAMAAIQRDAGGANVRVGRPYGISIDVICNDKIYRLDNPPEGK